MSVQMFGSILISRCNTQIDVFSSLDKLSLDKHSVALRHRIQGDDIKCLPPNTWNMRDKMHSYSRRPLTSPMVSEGIYLSPSRPTVKLRDYSEQRQEMDKKNCLPAQTDEKTVKTLPRSRLSFKRYERSGIRRIEWLAKSENNYNIPTTVREECTSNLSDCAIRNSFESHAKVRRCHSLREHGFYDSKKKRDCRFGLGDVSKSLSELVFAEDFGFPPQVADDHWMGYGYNTGRVELSADKGYLLWTNPKGTLEVTFTYKDSSQEFRCYIRPQLGDGVRIHEVKGRNENKELILNSCQPPRSLETPFFCMSNPFRGDEYSLEFGSNNGKIELLLEAVRRYKSVLNNRKNPVFKINYTLTV